MYNRFVDAFSSIDNELHSILNWTLKRERFFIKIKNRTKLVNAIDFGSEAKFSASNKDGDRLKVRVSGVWVCVYVYVRHTLSYLYLDYRGVFTQICIYFILNDTNIKYYKSNIQLTFWANQNSKIHIQFWVIVSVVHILSHKTLGSLFDLSISSEMAGKTTKWTMCDHHFRLLFSSHYHSEPLLFRLIKSTKWSYSNHIWSSLQFGSKYAKYTDLFSVDCYTDSSTR